MRQIRQSVFETNSSSSHSLVIKKTGNYYTDEELRYHIYLKDDGTWDIWDDGDLDFGRAPFRCLATFESKVRYAIAALCAYNHDRFSEIEEAVMEAIPEITKIKLPVARRWGYDKNEVYYGYRDEDILSPFLRDNCIPLKEFLTNKKYVVIVDGDEYCIWDDLKDSGLVNLDEIEKEHW